MKTENEWEQRIRTMFPDMTPSGDYDLLDELMGSLRVARMSRDTAEEMARMLTEKLKEARRTEPEAMSKGRMWLTVWCSVANANDCKETSRATVWADAAMRDYQARFPDNKI